MSELFVSYCEIPQVTAAQERKGSMGNLLTTLWTNWKSVFQQELGLTMNKTTSSTENIKLGNGRDFISLSRHWDFRAHNKNDCSEMFGAGKCIITILTACHVEGLIHFDSGLLALDDICKEEAVFTVLNVRCILWPSFFLKIIIVNEVYIQQDSLYSSHHFKNLNSVVLSVKGLIIQRGYFIFFCILFVI